MESVFQDCIREVKEQGRTVLLSSHILAEVEALCDRVTIIRAGRTQESGSLGELRHLSRTAIVAETAQPASSLGELSGVHGFVCDGHRVSFDVDNDQLPEAVRRLSDLGLRSLSSQPPTLEELFLRHYGEELARERAIGDGQHLTPT
jgi:ABC-2 type transport system ATP-binding protein